jgi:hypothetical protein
LKRFENRIVRLVTTELPKSTFPVEEQVQPHAIGGTDQWALLCTYNSALFLLTPANLFFIFY